MTALPGPAQRRRRGLPVVLFLAALMLSVTVAEVAVILQTGRLIGPWWTLAMLVAMGLVGSWLWKREGIRAWRALSQAFESGRLPAGELTDAALVLVGDMLREQATSSGQSDLAERLGEIRGELNARLLLAGA